MLNMARVIRQETGAEVEITIINEGRFSVFAMSEAAIVRARALLTRVPCIRLDSSLSYSDDDLLGATEYYDYYVLGQYVGSRRTLSEAQALKGGQ